MDSGAFGLWPASDATGWLRYCKRGGVMIVERIRTIDELAEDLEHVPALEVLRFAASQYAQSVAIASSFGAEDVVLIDLSSKIQPQIPVFVLDTGRLHQETYDVIDRCRERYGIEFEIHVPDAGALQHMLRQSGPNSFYRSIDDRHECCDIRKVEPLRRALSGRTAWVTGLRRGQAVTRRTMRKAELDLAHGGILKLNPLADWSEEEVWTYIRENDVPYNALHDKGFPSIGCAPCTRAVKAGEDIRAGRWWWEAPEQKECGLHLKQAS